MISFDYTTGHIERDFHFITEGSICELLSPIRSYVGGTGCSHCGCNKGRYTTFGFQGDTHSCILCSHIKAKDSKDASHLIYDYYEKFKAKAFQAYYD